MRGNRADPVVVMPIRLRDGRHQAVDALDHGVRLRAHRADFGWNSLRVEYQRRCHIFSVLLGRPLRQAVGEMLFLQRTPAKP
jgi:hypothetical protein